MGGLTNKPARVADLRDPLCKDKSKNNKPMKARICGTKTDFLIELLKLLNS